MLTNSTIVTLQRLSSGVPQLLSLAPKVKKERRNGREILDDPSRGSDVGGTRRRIITRQRFLNQSRAPDPKFLSEELVSD